mmetsp:Transcript_5724/g.17605  ORF Transcript_5724/g.17605 Transcript_5724/m.17605 type:complete len:208 (+) Transcript_5724:824-1447(+)
MLLIAVGVELPSLYFRLLRLLKSVNILGEHDAREVGIRDGIRLVPIRETDECVYDLGFDIEIEQLDHPTHLGTRNGAGVVSVENSEALPNVRKAVREVGIQRVVRLDHFLPVQPFQRVLAIDQAPPRWYLHRLSDVITGLDRKPGRCLQAQHLIPECNNVVTPHDSGKLLVRDCIIIFVIGESEEGVDESIRDVQVEEMHECAHFLL